MEQLAFADRIIVNKTDLAGDGRRERRDGGRGSWATGNPRVDGDATTSAGRKQEVGFADARVFCGLMVGGV